MDAASDPPNPRPEPAVGAPPRSPPPPALAGARFAVALTRDRAIHVTVSAQTWAAEVET